MTLYLYQFIDKPENVGNQETQISSFHYVKDEKTAEKMRKEGGWATVNKVEYSTLFKETIER